MTVTDAAVARPRGRNAAAPTGIPLRGWRDIALRTVRSVARHQAPTVAAGIAFYGLLAFIPALSAAASLYVLAAAAPAGAQQASALQGVVPEAALKLILAELVRLSGQPPAERFWIGVASIVALVGSINAAVTALLSGLNLAYEEDECRGLVRRGLTAAAFTAGVLALAPVTFASLLVGRGLAANLTAPALLVQGCRFVFLALVTSASLALLYRYGPCRRLARWRWVTPGGLLAAVAWLTTSSALSFYLTHFAHYERTYGVLGAVLAVMGWLWAAALVVLMGAELNAQLEAQTDHDTTA